MVHPVELSEADQAALAAVVRSGAHHRTRRRAEAILAHHRGQTINQLARHYGVDRDTVSHWLQRWRTGGVTGLVEGARSGRPARLGAAEKKSP